MRTIGIGIRREIGSFTCIGYNHHVGKVNNVCVERGLLYMYLEKRVFQSTQVPMQQITNAVFKKTIVNFTSLPVHVYLIC